MLNILPETVTLALLSIGGGMSIAFWRLGVTRAKLSTSRRLDFTSYLCGGLGLLVSVIAVANYQNNLNAMTRQQQFKLKSYQMLQDFLSKEEKPCPRPRSEIFRKNLEGDKRAKQCVMLIDYVYSLLSINFNLETKLPLPSVLARSELVDADIEETFFYFEQAVGEHNKHIEEYSVDITDKMNGTIFDLKVGLVALCFLSFSFGIGIVRRSFDAFLLEKHRGTQRPPRRQARKRRS